MSQMTKQIEQADIIQQPQLVLLHNQSTQISTSTENKKVQQNIQIQKQKICNENQYTTISPWNALFQYQKKEKEKSQILTKHKSQKQTQVLKKIRNKSVTKQMQSQPIISLPHRKVKPQLLNSQSQQQPIQVETNKIIHPSNLSVNIKSSAISNFRKNKYRKKNYIFEDKILKIKDITTKSSDSSVNIKGQIIFVWEKQTISQKWAKTEMICVQICDGTGSILLAVPTKVATNKNILNDLQIGKYVNIQKVQIRQKYPKRACLLFNQKSNMKILVHSQIPKQQIIDVQKLGLTLKQLQLQPIGRTCNIVCLVLQKSEKYYIRSFKNNDLSLCKLTVYDPIDNIRLSIKLWQQKADVKFYMNAVVYLLRGVRQYHASKDFNFRVLNHSRIQNYLGEMLRERQSKLRLVPNSMERINIGDSIENLKKLKKQYEQKAHKQAEKQKNINQNKLQKQNSLLEIQKSPQISNETPSDKIIISWSISIIKFISIQTKSSYPLSYTICQNCLHRVFPSISATSACPNCNKQNISNRYCIKCQFYDGNQTYLGQIYEQAGKKVFAVQDEIMKVQFFQQTNTNFKQVIVRQVIGDTIKAIIAITNEDIGNGVNLRGFYLVDLLPFIDQQTQQSFNDSIFCEVKNQIKQLTKIPSNKSIR